MPPESRLLRHALIAFVLALACIGFVDEPFARWIATHETYPAFWNTLLGHLEVPLGIEPYPWTGVWILAGGTIVTLAVPRLRRAAFAFALVALVHLLGRNLSLWLKFGFGRLRPTEWLGRGGPTFWRDGGFSFPSGHAILFASIVVPLAVCYPRTRPLFVVVAFAMAARVAVDAHFVSDVIAGYGVIALLTWACVRLLRRTLAAETRPASLR